MLHQCFASLCDLLLGIIYEKNHGLDKGQDVCIASCPLNSVTAQFPRMTLEAVGINNALFV
jgi:hypothetical protein